LSGHGCVDDDDVRPAELIPGDRKEAIELVGLGEIGIDPGTGTDLTDAGQCFVEMFGHAYANEYLDTFACEQDCGRSPDTGRAAGDDRFTAVKARPRGMRVG
jgi:hypothetical protein